MSELSVRETAAWAVREAIRLNERATWLDTADAVLAAVAAHDGLVEVLQAHRVSSGYDWSDEPYTTCYPCGPIPDGPAHLADVVRAWLRGES